MLINQIYPLFALIALYFRVNLQAFGGHPNKMFRIDKGVFRVAFICEVASIL